jgi:C4-dicarboxylate transporter DctM subunit
VSGLLLSSFLVLLVLGVPIYLALGVTGAALFGMDGSLLSYAQKLIDELNSTTLLAVPYFVIAATFMERGGVARALIDAAASWIGRVPGGIGLVSVLSCAIFAAMCGSSVATAIAMGTILVPAMHRGGYSRSFSAGVVGASSLPRFCRIRRACRYLHPQAVSRRCDTGASAGGIPGRLHYLVQPQKRLCRQ